MQTDKSQQNPQPIIEITSQQKQTAQKPYYFQTETKRLKQYYSRPENQNKLLSQRILFNNSTGIVRYFGQLKHQGAQTNNKELWVGVQWQEQGRGKHNGTVKGYQYFTCANNQGSMVKFEKIQFGYRLETALFRRYFRSQEMLHAKNIYQDLRMYKKQIDQKEKQQQKQQETDLEKKSQQKLTQNSQPVQKRRQHTIEYDADAYFDSLKKSKKIMVQFVGFDEIWTKINNLDKIQSISLPDCRICDLGPKGHLNDLLKSLKILSLEDNLLSTYNQVFQLGYELPQLEELSLTNNRLAEPQTNFEDLKTIDITGHNSFIELIEGKPLFPKLKTLVLINTGLRWKTLFKIIKAFNKLKELVLCRNQMTDYQNIDTKKMDSFDQLAFLNLQETNLADFKNVLCFKDLPKLQKLTLNKNPITEFGREISGFHNLKSLSVQSCQVKKSVVIYELSNFKNVQNLNFRHNPLNEIMGNSYVRLRSIAQFQKLTIINGAPLKKYQRKDSEIYYMRETFREYFALKNRPDYDYDFEDFIRWCNEHHPNIHLFIKRYGNPYEVQQKKQIQEIVKHEVKQTEIKKGTGMVKVKIHFEQLDTHDERKIPMTWTLVNLKNFFAKTVKIPAGQQHLRHKNENEKIDEQLTEDHKQLSFYNISEESVLIVRRKNPNGPISFTV